MPFPTFIVAGAQKGGTTTLHNMIGQHPGVFVSRPKEIHYFDRHYDRGPEWYASLFEPAAGQTAWGEATPIYMYEPLARKRMCRDLPDVKLVLILRDPVSRAYSHYWMNRSKGAEPLETFEEAVAAEPERHASEPRRISARYAYLDRGLYADQLEALEAAYGRDGLHVLLMEDLFGDPQARMAEVFAHIGADPAYAEKVEVVHSKQYKRGRAGIGSKAKGYPPIDPETKARLRAQFREPNQRLAQWLGRDLSAWMD
jgi:hypothetical protein